MPLIWLNLRMSPGRLARVVVVHRLGLAGERVDGLLHPAFVDRQFAAALRRLLGAPRRGELRNLPFQRARLCTSGTSAGRSC